jgi:hypothetical protein
MCILEKYKHCKLKLDANLKLIPVTLFDINDRGMNDFNEVYNYVKNYEEITPITWTPSGGISTSRRNFLPPMYGIKAGRSFVELVVLIKEGMWRFQFRNDYKKQETVMPGTKAITMFARKLHTEGIDLYKYLVYNGIKERDTVPKYIIKTDARYCPEVEDIKDAPIWENVNHIDFHSSFAGGLANAYPEFRNALEFFYKNRKQNPEYKGVLNSTVGIMWSEHYKGCGFVRLAKAAITDNNKRLMDLTKRLEESGRIPLLWNTDGVWYHGDIYHGEGEGSGLGEWENDHVNCKFRVKSRGCYEYIEDGCYYPVARGVAEERKVGWDWGSIFKPGNELIKYGFEEGNGVFKI